MFRTIIEDFEAKLLPPDPRSTETGIRGKAEWERYGSGEESLIVRIHKCMLSDGTIVDVRLRNGIIGRIVVTGGKGRLTLESKNGAVPHAAGGDEIALLADGTEILRGTFVPD